MNNKPEKLKLIKSTGYYPYLDDEELEDMISETYHIGADIHQPVLCYCGAVASVKCRHDGCEHLTCGTEYCEMSHSLNCKYNILR